MPSRDTDPLLGFSFSLEVSGKVTGFFTEVSGIGSEHEIVEHKPVTDKGIDFIQKIPGRLKYNDITLKRGVTAIKDVWDWRKMVEDGDIAGARASGTITMFNVSGDAIAKWSFEAGWPSKITMPALTSDSNAFVVEEMTVVVERIWRDQ